MTSFFPNAWPGLNRDQDMSDIVARMKNYIPGEPAHEEAVPEVLELAIAEIERLRKALGRIQRGSLSVLLDAALSESPINPDVLNEICKDAGAALIPDVVGSLPSPPAVEK